MTRKTVPTRLALVLAGLLVAGACSSGGDEPLDTAADATAAEDVDETTTSVTSTDAERTEPTEATGAGADTSAPTTSAPPATSEPTTTRATSGGTTSADSAPEDTATAAPARPIVPRSGTYTYERTTTDGDGTRTEQHDAGVERLSGDDRSGRLRITMQSEQGKLTNDVTVSDAGTLVEHSLIESPLGEIDCDWEPDWLLHGPFTQGSTWDVDTSCHDTATGLEVDVAITGSGTIVGHEQVDVNGTAVTAWVYETTTVTEFTVSSPTVNGTQRSESTSRTWVDPGRGMQVRDETRSTNSGDFQNGTSEVVSVFLGFAPA